jgi:quercetin dioxygenase-like cupin family protein
MSIAPTAQDVVNGTQERTSYAVLRPEQMASHDRGGGARTTPLVVPSVGEASFINGITEFAGGAAVPFHSHNCAESVVLLSGRGCLDVAGAAHELKAFDTTYIAPNVSHRFRNLSSTEPMKILWIYSRPDATRTLTETGETRPIAIEHAS